MMYGREKSDLVIVAVKSPNKTGRPAAEAMERRAGAEENASQHRTRRTQSRESVSQTPERVRTAARLCRHYPRWEPDAGKRAPWKTASRIPVSDRGSRERCFRVNRLTRRRKPHGDQSMTVKRGFGRTCQTRRPARPARYGQGWIA